MENSNTLQRLSVLPELLSVLHLHLLGDFLVAIGHFVLDRRLLVLLILGDEVREVAGSLGELPRW